MAQTAIITFPIRAPEGIQTRLAPQPGVVLTSIAHKTHAESPWHVMTLTERRWVVPVDCETCSITITITSTFMSPLHFLSSLTSHGTSLTWLVWCHQTDSAGACQFDGVVFFIGWIVIELRSGQNGPMYVNSACFFRNLIEKCQQYALGQLLKLFAASGMGSLAIFHHF